MANYGHLLRRNPAGVAWRLCFLLQRSVSVSINSIYPFFLQEHDMENSISNTRLIEIQQNIQLVNENGD